MEMNKALIRSIPSVERSSRTSLASCRASQTRSRLSRARRRPVATKAATFDTAWSTSASRSSRKEAAQEPHRQGDSNEDGSQGAFPGPTCMFLGPLEGADQATLEEFYRQAKDSYYSGRPLIVDEMFDRVEVHLRWLRSPVVQKFPRCSIQRHTTYSDAQDDPSQMAALHTVWGSILALGGFLTVGPALLTAHLVWEHATSEEALLGIASMPHPLVTTTWTLMCAMSMGLGVTLASLSVSSLQGMQKGRMIALKGVCPSCSEEVYAFVKLEGRDRRPRHKTDCHVCGQKLVFHATLEPKPQGEHEDQPHTAIRSVEGEDHTSEWVYGRVYAVARSEDLKPR